MSEHSTGTPPNLWGELKSGNVRITARLLVGLAFLALGVLWTLDNFDFLDADAVVRWWPVLVAVFGVAKLSGWGTRQSTFAGVLWLIAAGWLLLHAMGFVRHGIDGLWPLALIILGSRLLMSSMRRSAAAERVRPSGSSAANVDEQGRVKVDAVMAGVERRFRAGVFRGGEIFALMANVELDLREATLAEGRAELEANSVLANIVLMLPRHWTVINHTTPVMGAVEDHTQPPAEAESRRETLILRGVAVMGGIEIRN
jgi:hypothetical protein